MFWSASASFLEDIFGREHVLVNHIFEFFNFEVCPLPQLNVCLPQIHTFEELLDFDKLCITLVVGFNKFGDLGWC
jgi:hypothetical protein